MRIRTPGGASKRSGLTLVEVTVALVLVTIVLLASATVFSSSLAATGQASRLATGSDFLETTMEEVGAQLYPNLLSLDGNRVFDNTDASDSNFAVDLTVFQVDVDLLQIRAVLSDLRTGREVTRLTTQRSDH